MGKVAKSQKSWEQLEKVGEKLEIVGKSCQKSQKLTKPETILKSLKNLRNFENLKTI